MKKIIAHFITLCVFSFSGIAQQWYHGYSPYFRNINDVYISDYDVIVAAGGKESNDNIETVIRTQDYANNWGIITDVPFTSWLRDLHFVSDSTGYVAGFEGKLKKTTDLGTTWTTLNSSTSRNLNSIYFTNSQTGFCAGGNSTEPNQIIIKTIDGGQNWNAVHTAADFWLEDIYFINQFTGVAVGDSGVILSSSDAGDSWQTVNAPLIRHYNSIHFVNENVGFIAGGNFENLTILKTENGGASWDINLDQIGGELNDIYFIDENIGYAVGKKGAFLKTIDGGTNWVQQTISDLNETVELNTVLFKSETFGIAMGQFGEYFLLGNFQPPVVQTMGYILISPNEVILQSAVNTNNVVSGVSFIYSTDQSLTNPLGVSTETLLNSSSLEAVNIVVSQIAPETTYYYTCKVSNITGTWYGDTLTFSTSSNINNSLINIQPATSVTNTSATLNGIISNLPHTSSIFFEYSLAEGLSITTLQATPAIINDLQQHVVSVDISGLTANTSYKYRLKVINNIGTFYSQYLQVYTGENTIPNPDFEFWSNASVEKPTNWFHIFGPIAKETPGATGNFAVKLESTAQTFGALANGILADGGIPYSARPDSVSIMLKYDIMLQDTGYIIVILKKQSQVISFNRFPLAGASPPSFTEYKFPLQYFSQEFPDTLSMGVIASSPFDTVYSNFGSWIIADDIKLTGNVNQLPNNSFENWETYSCTLLDSWGYTDPYNFGYYSNPDENTVRRTTDSQSGTYAAELINLNLNGYMGRGRISTFTPVVLPSDGETYPCFPVNHKPFALNGYYKFFPVHGDTLTIDCNLFNNGIEIGSGRLMTIYASEYVFQPFSVLINYFEQNQEPDSAFIEIKAHYNSSPFHAGSRVIVDNLRFDGFASDILLFLTEENVKQEVVLYPNPAKDMVFISTTDNSEINGAIEIYDLTGQLISKSTLQGNNSAIAISHLTPGIYFIRILNSIGKSVFVEKLIKN